MPIEIDSKTYYYTSEALKQVGITRTTFYKWLKEKKIKDVSLRDRNKRRLFSIEDIQRIKDYFQATTIV